MTKEIRGLVVPTITVFTPEDLIDEDGLRRHTRFLIESGVDGIFAVGSTGESQKLSIEERKRVVEIVLDETAREVPVLAGTGVETTRGTIALSKHAEAAGADGVVIVPPTYTRITLREVVEHYKTVSQNIGIPIMVYNNPARSMIDLTPDALAKLSEIKNIRLVKESSGDLRRIDQIINKTAGKLTVMMGTDSIAFEGMLAGAKGWVASSANVIPKECAAITGAALAGDYAKAKDLFYRALPFFNAIETQVDVTVKEALLLLGHRVGHPRKPSLPMEADQVNELRKRLLSLGTVGSVIPIGRQHT
ncbi:MAG: 4-hydroxy-tetrahydrodipicolinate synthase [Nitrososphaerales archaeon]|jgi:4-hydroxy-tetrahydrodipicolinate synthase